MAEKQNLTIQLDSDTLRKARVLAAERSTSISRLVAEELERMVRDDEQYKRACQEAVADLEAGYHLGGGALPSRADLYERHG